MLTLVVGSRWKCEQDYGRWVPRNLGERGRGSVASAEMLTLGSSDKG